jgi:hypothetical protein
MEAVTVAAVDKETVLQLLVCGQLTFRVRRMQDRASRWATTVMGLPPTYLLPSLRRGEAMFLMGRMVPPGMVSHIHRRNCLEISKLKSVKTLRAAIWV